MSSITGEASSLWQAPASVPDHRRDAGERYPLASLLLIAIAALLSGRRDQLAVRPVGPAAPPADKDVLVIISNCPQLYNPCSGWNPTPVRIIVWRAGK